MKLTLKTPANFNFKRTAISHGWYALPPFDLDDSSWVLTRVIDSGNGQPLTVKLLAGDGCLKIESKLSVSRQTAAKVVRDVRHMLRIDENLAGFYDSVSAEPEFGWIAASGAGRLLRAPTVFEDLVKTICTTNCSWALTDKMVRALVSLLGEPAADGRHAFPDAKTMAEAPASFYRDEVRAGYRAPYLKELAERVAGQELDPESWLSSGLPTPELRKQMKQVKGVGDYAAENLLKLVGRYDVLALDSWVRAKFARTRNRARSASDKKIGRFYARFGEWKGLVLWCDLTRDWLETPSDLKW
ncbi:MAG TPA: hypothetical protein VKM94_15225 [Blastocatellia bacterium]|nr:hypothetical protein [Blastocatellia bacterium]